jgi:hypothetical protein
MKVPGLLVCLLLLSSCASTPQSSKLRTSGPGSLPSAVELINTPFYPQTQYQCGPAALATVLQARDVTTTPEELSRQVYIPERKGSLQIEMAVATRRHHMLPYKLAPRLTDIFTEIAAGNPVLVLQNLGFEWYPQWHYAVVVGYDTNNHELILRSGTTKRWLTSFEVFERTWKRAGFWALVIVPIGEIPATAKPLDYLKTAYAFEETGQSELAIKAYQSASRQWPDVAVIWMTLGNMAFDKHDWQQAVSAFSTASILQPESVISWNNLAYALHAYGCRVQAKMALQCGLKVLPTDKNLQDSWTELINDSIVKDRAECPLIQCN